MTKEVKWTEFHSISCRASIYYIKDTDRFQLTTLEYVYFYRINNDDYVPYLENVMKNYMECSQMIIGKKVKNCIAYKTNQKSFDIYQRKYYHNLRVCVNDKNLDGAKGLELITLQMILITNKDHLLVYDNKNC